MDDFRKKHAGKELSNYTTPPSPKYKKLNKTLRSRLKRETKKALAAAQDIFPDSRPANAEEAAALNRATARLFRPVKAHYDNVGHPNPCGLMDCPTCGGWED